MPEKSSLENNDTLDSLPITSKNSSLKNDIILYPLSKVR